MKADGSTTRVLLTKPAAGKYPLGCDLYPPMIPMGLGFLARALRDYNVDYAMSDNYLASFGQTNWNDSKFRTSLRDYRPTHVCVSAMSVEWPEALQLIRTTREELPECQIYCGGPHARFASKEISNLCDAVVVGEGERALPHLLTGTISPEFRNGNIIEYPFIDPLDSLVHSTNGRKEMIPWDDFSPLQYNLVMPWLGLDRAPVVNLNTSRGCPFSCKFCSILGLWGRGFRYFTAPVIVDEIQDLKERFGINGVCFREDNFIVLRERVEKMCEMLIDRQLNIDWAAEARVDSIDEPLADLMRRSCCKGLLFGVESGSEWMLKAMQKGITKEVTRRAIAICKQHGIKSYATIVYGLPGELPEHRKATKEFLSDIKPDFVEESVYLGIPGSAYYSELLREGNWEFFDPVTLHIYPRGYKQLYRETVKHQDGVLPY